MKSFIILVATLTAGVSVMEGCSSAGGTAPGGGGGNGGSAGGMLTAADAKITGSVTQCTGTTPTPLPSDVQVPACTRPECNHAACITQAQITQFAPQVSSTVIGLLGTCTDASQLCVPIDYIATTGNFLVKSCTSLVGLEGRCISKCVPKIYDELGYLPQESCSPDERCAPCFDPRFPAGQDDTQACHTGCDPGPTQTNPTKFVSCGSGAGLCVPQNLVPANYLPSVPVADCTQSGYVCAPTKKVQDINYQFPTCVPSSSVFSTTPDGPNGQKGACVPHYLVDNFPSVPSGIIMQDTCATGDLCAPCNNPISNPPNQPTGACPLP